MDLFSMNLDSRFRFAAHYPGARAEVLCDPTRIYRIEHASGSGWTPEGQAGRFERISAKDSPLSGNGEVLAIAAQMRLAIATNWGRAAFQLKETPVRRRLAGGQL